MHTSAVFGKTSLLPSEIEIREDRYTVRFARDDRELDQVLKLRFEVFNLELNEGFEASYINERDEDRFDRSCLHLIVVENSSDRIVGTYRLRTLEMAGSEFGFYTSDEFAIEALPFDLLANSVELGRACIAREHRNSRVLFLLWRGVARFLTVVGKRYLFGCCSLSTQDFTDGIKAERLLRSMNVVHPSIRVEPRADFRPMDSDFHTIDDGSDYKIPKLFETYLRIGAQVLSGPVIDRSFKTIDFLVLVDSDSLSDRYSQLFFS